MRHADAAELAAGLEAIRSAPATVGRVELIVRRPAVDEGGARGGRAFAGGGLAATVAGAGQPFDGGRSADPAAADPQELLFFGLLAAWEARGQGLAGDQLYVDLD